MCHVGRAKRFYVPMSEKERMNRDSCRTKKRRALGTGIKRLKALAVDKTKIKRCKKCVARIASNRVPASFSSSMLRNMTL
jgi:hypothetical protein